MSTPAQRMLVIGEDALSVALGERLVQACLPDWQLVHPSIDTKGVTKLQAALPRYLVQAQHVQPVLCVADTDGACPVAWRQRWLPRPHARMVLRLANTESESWLLADREGFARHLGLPLNKLPWQPDGEPDPKGLILTLARKSTLRHVRHELVSADNPGKPGSGYNLHLVQFTRQHWSAQAAAEHSPSLQRAMQCLQRLPAQL